MILAGGIVKNGNPPVTALRQRQPPLHKGAFGGTVSTINYILYAPVKKQAHCQRSEPVVYFALTMLSACSSSFSNFSRRWRRFRQSATCRSSTAH